MAKPKLEGLSIRRNPKGGHTVTHEYAAAPKFTAGKNGGMGMDQQAPETHNFDAGDQAGLLNHIASALSLKAMEKGPAKGAPPMRGMPEE
jgi:hypothetical protein